jgi:hypothetical protein
MRAYRRTGVVAKTVAVTVAVCAAGFGASGMAAVADEKAAGQLVAGSAAADDDTPPSIVETFEYPGAAQIAIDRGILLKKGDGNLLLTDCVTGADTVELRARNRDPFCFRLVSGSGWLTLELTDAYLVLGDSKHTTEVDYTVRDEKNSVTVAPGGAEGIGEGTGSGAAVIVELRVGA